MFRIKHNINSSVIRFTTRLVTQNFSQIHGIDFWEIYTSIVWRKSLQIYVVLCLILNLVIYQFDIIDV